MDVALLVKALGGFFAIMNPFVALPMFLALTSTYQAAQQRRTAIRVVFYTVAMGAAIMAGGQLMLSFFGISVNHFRVAGGLVLLMIALGMLNGGSSAHEGSDQEKQHHPTSLEDADVSFYPLTFPMIMGPGTITTIMVFTGGATNLPAWVAVIAGFLVVVAVLFGVLWFAPAIGHRMSQTLRVIMTRLMGMILAAIAVEMIVAGLLALIPALAN